jgi:hypothetical protein
MGCSGPAADVSKRSAYPAAGASRMSRVGMSGSAGGAERQIEGTSACPDGTSASSRGRVVSDSPLAGGCSGPQVLPVRVRRPGPTWFPGPARKAALGGRRAGAQCVADLAPRMAVLEQDVNQFVLGRAQLLDGDRHEAEGIKPVSGCTSLGDRAESERDLVAEPSQFETGHWYRTRGRPVAGLVDAARRGSGTAHVDRPAKRGQGRAGPSAASGLVPERGAGGQSCWDGSASPSTVRGSAADRMATFCGGSAGLLTSRTLTSSNPWS